MKQMEIRQKISNHPINEDIEREVVIRRNKKIIKYASNIIKTKN